MIESGTTPGFPLDEDITMTSRLHHTQLTEIAEKAPVCYNTGGRRPEW
jgi:hypothetical protein